MLRRADNALTRAVQVLGADQGLASFARSNRGELADPSHLKRIFRKTILILAEFRVANWQDQVLRGRQAFDQGKFNEAIALFEAASRAKNHFRIFIWLKKAHLGACEELGRANAIGAPMHPNDHIELHKTEVARIDQALAYHYDSVEYMNSISDEATVYLPDGRAFLKYACERAKLPGLWLEFGVHKGESINLIATFTESPVHGFDSFEGLPEDFLDLPKGTFSLEGRLPAVRPNVILYKGWFADTLPGFLRADLAPVSLVHIDCDLYSSAKTVFDLLSERLVRPGTIVMMDDYINAPGWRNRIHQAFHEFADRTKIRSRFFAFEDFRAAVLVV